MNSSRSLRRPARILLVAVIYLIAGKLGLRLAFVNPSATAVWPPTGIALAALLILDHQVWPGVFLGAFLVNITTAGSIATSVGIAVGNTLEALVGCYLVNRFAHGDKAFSRAQDIFRFAALAGLVSTSVSATLGVASLSLGCLARWSEFGAIWSTWWLWDAGGALVVAPLLVLWLRDPHLRWTRAQVAEAVVLLIGILFIGQSVFGGFFPSSTRNYPFEFFCIPFLNWATFRFSPRETAVATFVIAAIAISGTLAGFGPFVRGSKNESLVLLQVYVGISAVTGLALAALVSERKEIAEKLQRLAASDALTGLANYRRVLAQAPAYGFTVAQARILLLRLKEGRTSRLIFIPDEHDVSHLPGWVRAPKQITDGHLSKLASAKGAVLATLDESIAGSYLIPR